MTRPLLVLDVVGLTPRLLEHAPRLRAIAREGFVAPLEPVLPAVTLPVQATFTTGRPPSGHGIVGNGWFFRELEEVWFWRQPGRLVQGDHLLDDLRALDPSASAGWLFWWFAMRDDCDLVVTPRPAYPADGRKIPDVWTRPVELRERLVERLGPFPLFRFWGPAADLTSSRWIAEAARYVLTEHDPALLLVYLPHLDYDLQRLGPDDPSIPQQVRAIDEVAGSLAEEALARGRRVVVLSEYGIERVSAPVFPNRFLREHGLLQVRANAVGELLDPIGSRAFAVCDHQFAHVYVRRPEDLEPVREALTRLEGVERVLGPEELREAGLDHPRSGELALVAAPGRWFAYPYWLDDERAPDFARTVDIHRKPGYDPAELFLDPALRFRRARIALHLLRLRLGFRSLLRVVPLDPSLVRGSHGRLPTSAEEGPLLISSSKEGERPAFHATEVRAFLRSVLAGG